MRVHDLLLIPELFLPEENVVVWGGGFTEDEVKNIVAQCELFEFNKGKVGGNLDQSLNLDIRDTDITWVEPCDATVFIYRRMAELAAKINHDKFQLDLTHFQPFQYGKYKKEGHYDWHTDSGPTLQEHRKLTFVVGLSDPDDYEGGELEINITGNHEKSFTTKIKKGDVVVFPSYLPHRVKSVTKGTRMTMVGWAVGPKAR